jgi:hypothetical protein
LMKLNPKKDGFLINIFFIANDIMNIWKIIFTNFLVIDKKWFTTLVIEVLIREVLNETQTEPSIRFNLRINLSLNFLFKKKLTK